MKLLLLYCLLGELKFNWLDNCFNADRGDVPKGSAEIFFRKVKFWTEDGEEEAPPIFVGTFSFSTLMYAWYYFASL